MLKVIKSILMGVLVIMVLFFILAIAVSFSQGGLNSMFASLTSSSDVEMFTKKAISEHNISVCDDPHLQGGGDSSTASLRNRCYLAYATQFPREDVCKTRHLAAVERFNAGEIGMIDDSYELCVEYEAKAALDPKICLQTEKIPGQPNHEQSICVSYVANLLKDKTVCNVLTTTADKQDCAERVNF